jgi:hypothetical protein
VTKSDWATLEKEDAERYSSVAKYFDAFSELKTGLGPLDIGAAMCAEALSSSNPDVS